MCSYLPEAFEGFQDLCDFSEAGLGAYAEMGGEGGGGGAEIVCNAASLIPDDDDSL